MKKFFCAVALMMSISSSGFAMNFSQPQWVGHYIWNIVRPWFIICGETYNSAKPLKGYYYYNGFKHKVNEYVLNGRKCNVYNKGIARFSNGDDALYLHYNYNYSDSYERLGGKDFKNTLDFHTGNSYEIFKVTTDSGYTFYLLRDSIVDIENAYFIFIARKPDGSWIKFFNTEEIRKKYIAQLPIYSFEAATNKDTIILRYHVSENAHYIAKNYDPNEHGEFRFKWDDKAQWFSVQHIKY